MQYTRSCWESESGYETSLRRKLTGLANEHSEEQSLKTNEPREEPKKRSAEREKYQVVGRTSEEMDH